MPAGFPLGYHERPSPPHLAHWIERLWWRRTEGQPHEPGGRILPDGRIDLVWSESLGVLVAGPQTRFLLRPFTPPFVAIGVRFHLGAAALVLRVPASALIDAYVPLDAIDGRLAAAISTRLAAAPTPTHALAGFAAVLARRCAELGPPDPLVRAIAAALGRKRARVAELADSVFISERQLERRFRGNVGYGPKTLQRVLRFQRMVNELACVHGDSGDLSRLAAWAGYADQAHLTRESRELSGLTPRELRRWVSA